MDDDALTATPCQVLWNLRIALAALLALLLAFEPTHCLRAAIALGEFAPQSDSAADETEDGEEEATATAGICRRASSVQSADRSSFVLPEPRKRVGSRRLSRAFSDTPNGLGFHLRC